MSTSIVGSSNVALSAWDALYQASPIILQGGSFANTATGVMPFVGLLGSLLALGAGLLTNSPSPTLGKFEVIPGGSLVKQSIATYPYPNLQVAANATIQEPNNVSLLLRSPVHDGFGYLTKPAIFTALQVALQNHNNAGGSYIVLTPAYMYQNGILLNMIDVTSGESKQPQVEWQFDFYFPLITVQQVGNALNTMMTKFAGGQPITGAPSWLPTG